MLDTEVKNRHCSVDFDISVTEEFRYEGCGLAVLKIKVECGHSQPGHWERSEGPNPRQKNIIIQHTDWPFSGPKER